MRQVHDTQTEECMAAKFFKIGTRDWRFSNAASAKFRSVTGPLHISVDDHEPADFIVEMVTRIAGGVMEKKAKQAVKFLL